MNLFIKAGSHGNPGPAGFAVRLESNARELITDARYVGHRTANYAAFAGLVFGLTEALSRGADQVRVFSDLTLLVGIMKGKMKCDNHELCPLAEQASGLTIHIGSVTFLQSRIDAKLKKIINNEITMKGSNIEAICPDSQFVYAIPCAEIAG